MEWGRDSPLNIQQFYWKAQELQALQCYFLATPVKMHTPAQRNTWKLCTWNKIYKINLRWHIHVLDFICIKKLTRTVPDNIIPTEGPLLNKCQGDMSPWPLSLTLDQGHYLPIGYHNLYAMCEPLMFCSLKVLDQTWKRNAQTEF